MRFIEGQTLEDALRAYHAGPPDAVAFRRLLQSFIQVCETIAYAHSRGVIHRDLKPKNIMLGKFGETIVVDWGLAKVVGRGGEEAPGDLDATLRPVSESSLDRTEMGAAVGTIPYMSPEQAAGRWDVIDASSDVYNLGSVLYELLTGRPKLEGGNWPELQQKIQRGEFPRPSSVKPGVPRALEAVCLKAMALKPEDRYPSAQTLASEIELWLADEPVGAYREPIAGRVRRWARRHRVLVASGMIASVALAASAWVISVQETKIATAKAMTNVFRADVAFQGRRQSALVQRQTDVMDSARAAFNALGAQIEHDPRLDTPGLQPLRRVMLRRVVRFWDDAIAIEATSAKARSGRTYPYQRQRLLYVARMGEHKAAAAEAETLWERERSGAAAYDLGRVYSICATEAQDDPALAQRYADHAVKLLIAASRAGVLRNLKPEEALDRDPDFAVLRPREDFHKLNRALEAKAK
jgi:hypothetical protein